MRNQKKYPILRARWRVNKHSDPIFLLHFLMFISWMFIMPSFKKSLIVEQFQGNYLNHQLNWLILPSQPSLVGLDLKLFFTGNKQATTTKRCKCPGLYLQKKYILPILKFTVLIAFCLSGQTTNLEPLILALILSKRPACHWYFLFLFSSSWAHLCIPLMITKVYHSLI